MAKTNLLYSNIHRHGPNLQFIQLSLSANSKTVI